MKLIKIIFLVPLLAVTTAYAQDFTCEQIKEKKVRAGCIAKRDKPVKAAENIQDAFVKQAKGAVAQTLMDPSSATFSKLKYVENQERKSQALCGEMNAKNSYGGYVGSKPFFALLAPPEEGGSAVWTTWTMQVPRKDDLGGIDRQIKLVTLAMSYCEDKAAKSTSIAD